MRPYFLHLKTQRRFSRARSPQAICAIKLFWEKSLRRPWPAEVARVRADPQFKLPVVLSATAVRRLLAAVPALDHRAALTTIYSCGLRLAEGLHREVRASTPSACSCTCAGARATATATCRCPQRTLVLLREGWKNHRHPRFLFPGRGHNGQGASTATVPMCRSTRQRTFRLAREASGGQKDCPLHTLRHSYVPHLLEQGENLRQIQVNLGHKSPTVTALYTHLTSLCQTQHQQRLNGFMNDL